MRITPSEALVETLEAQGVKYVFGIVGSAFMDALDIFPAAGIKFIPVVHEQGAAHMADGYSRITGKHGVCIGQNGPGVTNFVTAIAAAYWAHSPVVAITPETGSSSMGLGGFQETEQLPIFSKITKFQAHVNRSDRIAEFCNRAFDYALFEKGPAQLNIPRDMFYDELDINLPKPNRIKQGAGNSEDIKKAIEVISKAKFPVIVSGGGVISSNAVNDVVILAEKLGAPVVNSYLHNDSFPANHPQWCGSLGYQGSKAGMNLISKADVVLAVGTRLGPFGTLPQYGIDYWPKNAEIIQIDCDHRMLGLVKPINIGLLGDAGESVRVMNSMLDNSLEALNATKSARLAEVKQQKDAWESELNSWTQEKDDWSMDISNEDPNLPHPRQILRELEKAMPENAMVSTDIGNICSVSNSYLRFNQPRSFLAAMSFGNCGYAFPTMIGAKVAAPDRPGFAYVGDGAWGMSMMETLTCVRENIPVTAIVFNNRQWGAEKKNQVDFYNNRFLGSNINETNWSEIAKSMGAEGIRIDNKDQVGDALKQTTQAQKEGKTTILEIMVTRELGDPFRRDALKHPVRFLDKYKNFV